MQPPARAVELRLGSRVPLYAVLLLCLLSCVGQGIAYFDSDSYDQFNVGVFFVIISSAVAGVVATLAGYPLSRQIDAELSGGTQPAQERKHNQHGLLRGLKFCLAGAVVEAVVGELLALVAVLSGATNDWSTLFGGLTLGLLVGGACLLLGWVAGLLVLWPILALFGILRRRVSGKPVNEAVGAVSVLSLTVIAFAITGVLGIGSADDDVIGTPQGRGLAEIAILLTRYSGTPTEQVMSWVARALLAGIVLEIVWLRHVAIIRKRERALAETARE